jgi:hypothetical protein
MNRSMTVAMMFAVAACAGSQASKTDASSSGSMSSSGASSSGMQSGTSGSGMQSGGQSFSAKMDAASEVPQPNLGSAMPSCTATFQSDGQSLTYKVDAQGLSSPFTAAHIHVGAPGVAGPVVAPLTMSDSGNGSASGSGTVDASSIKGKNPDGSPMSMKDVVTLLGSGNAYVNVHTQNNKAGECRGQIEASR